MSADNTEDHAALLAEIGELIDDAAEETFVLFSQDLPHNDLGILDDKASEIDIDINGRQYLIGQSSGLLKSQRSAGTTGAMLWKVTPRIAQWLASSDSLLWKKGLLTSSTNILELGCGVAGLVGMAVSPLVSSYVLSDQAYVLRVLKENIIRNKDQSNKKSKPTKAKNTSSTSAFDKLHIMALDWEQDSVQNLKEVLPSISRFDVLLVCDCIYNTYLIEPLTQTCVDICRLDTSIPTLVIIAQQLRTDDVFEEWLSRFMKDFRVWRVRNDCLPPALHSTSGYVVHTALLHSNHLITTT